MTYNLHFCLGDPWGDGHGHHSEHHMESNHSVEEITDAYKKACDIIGFDFVETIASEYECPWYLDEELTDLFLKYNIIDEDQVNRTDDDKYYPINCYNFDDGLSDYIDMFERLIRLVIPDFNWKKRDLKEDDLTILDGAGYGLLGP